MDLEFPRVSGVILCLPKSSLLGHLPPLVLKHPGNGLEMPIKVKNKKAVMLGHCHARSLAVIAVTPPFFPVAAQTSLRTFRIYMSAAAFAFCLCTEHQRQPNRSVLVMPHVVDAPNAVPR